jgi:hypothetical protein
VTSCRFTQDFWYPFKTEIILVYSAGSLHQTHEITSHHTPSHTTFRTATEALSPTVSSTFVSTVLASHIIVKDLPLAPQISSHFIMPFPPCSALLANTPRSASFATNASMSVSSIAVIHKIIRTSHLSTTTSSSRSRAGRFGTGSHWRVSI